MIREFRCPAGHLTESIFLTSARDAVTDSIECRTCGKSAIKLIFSVVANPNLVAGVGGFYKPSSSGK